MTERSMLAVSVTSLSWTAMRSGAMYSGVPSIPSYPAT